MNWKCRLGFHKWYYDLWHGAWARGTRRRKCTRCFRWQRWVQDDKGNHTHWEWL